MELIFASEYAEYLLLVNGIAILFYIAAKKNKKQRAMKFGNYETLQKVAGKDFLKSSNVILITRMLALTALIIGISSPVLIQETTSSNTDYVLAIDKSPNMMVRDVEPSRFEAAKTSAQNFVDILDNSTNVGLISFSGNVDIEAELEGTVTGNQIQGIEPGGTAGTSLGNAIYTGSTLLMNSTAESKSLVLITAGRDTAGQINRSVQFANKNNVTVNTVGIGSSESSENSFDTIEGQNASEAVYPAVNETLLQSISNSTGGESIRASSRNEMRNAFLSIESSESRNDISVYFIVIATILILLEWVLGTTRYSILP